ncbi:SemiSWEET family sugar transporter [Flavobacterium zepuense]|uniref:SemiSWEET family sugar transporter n=1 Tax=Flavobacterium zepuense TaxID=2593302 RepID=UPI001C8F5CD0|nr:SemiSWEET transporter [Flavobacterium zepuense]
MDNVEILGLIAAGFVTVANIPQTIKIVKTRSTKSISAITYAMLFVGMVLWVIYGIYKDDLPIIMANSIAAALCGTILTVKCLAKFRGNETS